MHKALTVIALPVLNEDGFATGETNRKEAGDKITKAEFDAAGQTDEDIQAMTAAGSISDDLDADLHPDHRPVPAAASSIEAMVESAKEMVSRLGDKAPDEIQKLAKLD